MILDQSGNPIPPNPPPPQQSDNSVGENSLQQKSYSEHLTTNQRSFLAAFSRLGTVTHAAKSANIDRRNHNVWLTDPVYARAFLQAKEEATDYLEREAIRRATEGVQEADGWWYDKDSNSFKPKGFVTKYSDTLLIFLMKGASPERWRDRIEQINLSEIDPSKLTPKMLEQITDALIKQASGGDPAIEAEIHRQAALEAGVVVDAVSEPVEEEKKDEV